MSRGGGPQPGDRRLSRRYPIAAGLKYKAVSSDGFTIEGFGRTLNLSAGGVLFEFDQSLPLGTRIELSIAWPALLNGSLALNLRVCGCVARSHENSCAIRIREHEFCLRGGLRVATPRVRVPIPAAAAHAAAGSFAPVAAP
jgi:hypothetical protein